MAYSQLFLVLLTASNLIYHLNAQQYKGTPPTTAILKSSVELKCEYTGDDGQFTEWFKDNDVPINAEKPGHYTVKQNEKESILIIRIFVQADANVTKWYVKTKKAGETQPPNCEFGQINLQSSPQGITTNRESEKIDSAQGSVRRNENDPITLRCIILPEASNNNIRWEFSKDEKAFSEVPSGVEIKDNEIKIDEIKKYHRGYYRCTLNDASFTILLRVKDRFAALWPFLGIVGVLIVLVNIILIFEKRQKSNKKPVVNDDEEQDQTQDLIARTTTKGSDNDTKKRAVKA
jgi:hypothetical protein